MIRSVAVASVVFLCACVVLVGAGTSVAASAPHGASAEPAVDVAPHSGTAISGSPAAVAQGTSTGETGGDGEMWMVLGVLVVILGLVGGAVWQSGALSRGVDVPGDSAASAAGAAAESAGARTDHGTVGEEELLSDSDRVRQLLEENGGRMKQVDIVAETDWSKSKVSMLLSEMEEDGEISKLRVGRENIISLSGHEPDAAGSPFEDEE